MARKTDVGHVGKPVLYVRILLNQHLLNIVFTFCTQNTINYSYSFTIYAALNVIGIIIVIFERCWFKIYRETKESLWIKKLKAFEPLGLNIKLDRHWLFINKIPRNQRHKLFYLHCNVMSGSSTLWMLIFEKFNSIRW
jgi:hypothetical protein